MNRRIILVDIPWVRKKDPPLPLGHAALLAVLRRRPQTEARSVLFPASARMLDAEAMASKLQSLAAGAQSGPADIAISSYIWSDETTRSLCTALRQRGFKGRLILGGPQISYTGPGLEDLYPEADVFIRGYAEDALRLLAENPGRQDITGVHYAGDEDRCHQAQVDLAALPSPWLDGIIQLNGQRFLRWETQRGCPYRCAFCQHRDPGSRVCRQAYPMQRIKQEVELFSRAQVSEIAVLDPIFNIGRRAQQVLEQFSRQGFKGRLSLQCRAEFVTADFLAAARGLNVCLEFGLQTIHPQEGEAVCRRNNLSKADEALREVKHLGIDHEVSIIYGLPEQTLGSFQETVRWCIERKVPVIKAFPLLLLRGTTLEVQRERWGFELGNGDMPVVVGSDTYNQEEWTMMARIAEALRRTEGCHPAHMTDLLKLAGQVEPGAVLPYQQPSRRAA